PSLAHALPAPRALPAGRRSARSDRAARIGTRARGPPSDAAGSDGHGEDPYGGADHRALEPPRARDLAQQDAGGPALRGVPAVLPRERRRLLHLLLRL